MAFEEACAQMRECLEIDPGNENLRQLLRKCELGKQNFDDEVQRTGSPPPSQRTTGNTELSAVPEDVPVGMNVSGE
jgi:hypothetical protein